jgi:hypothetical protein
MGRLIYSAIIYLNPRLELLDQRRFSGGVAYMRYAVRR